MNENKKPKKVGRPKLPKNHAHGRTIIVRVKEEDFKIYAKIAKTNKQTLSEWIRTTLKNSVPG